MSFLSRKASGENTLVIDIASGSTGAALVHVGSDGLPEILARARTPFFLSAGPTKGALENAMLVSLRATLGSVAKSTPALSAKGAGSAIERAVISFSSPWISSHLKTVIIAKEKNFSFTKSVMDSIIDEEKELFLSSLKESFEEESEVFESVVTNLYLNGYETNNPAKGKVKNAEMTFLLSATTKELLAKIEEELIKSVGVKRGVALHSFMFAFYKVLSHSFHSLHSALLINMTSELTDILFLRHGNSALSASLPFGPASIARSVSERLGIPIELGYSYLSLFASGSFDQATMEAVDTVFTEVESKWQSMWKSMGESIPEGSSVPYSVFLIVPNGSEKIVKTFLTSVLPGRNVILLGETNAFTKELVKAEPEMLRDESILVLSSFSNIIN